MGLRNDCYAKIWCARPYQKIYYCQVSVSQKNKETGEYKNLYSGTVVFAGKAAEKVALLGLPEKVDRESPVGKSVKILQTDLNSYYNNKKRDRLLELAKGITELEYFIKEKCNEETMTVWDIEVDGQPKAKETAKEASTEITGEEEFMQVPDDMEDEGLPFNQ